MNRAIALACTLAVLACTPSVPVHPRNFCDNCDSLDSSRWSKAEWALGRGHVRAENDSAGGGYFSLKLRAHTWDGAEVYTPTQYPYGCARAWYRCAPVAGAISALFFFQGIKARNDEIDVEVHRDSLDWRISFTVWKAGSQTWSTGYHPSFDPSAEFHEYSIDWGTDSIAFLVDGQFRCAYAGSGQPNDAMQLHLNCWWPTSLAAVKPDSDELMQVELVSYTELEPSDTADRASSSKKTTTEDTEKR